MIEVAWTALSEHVILAGAVVGALVVIAGGIRRLTRGIRKVIDWGIRVEKAVEDVPRLREGLTKARQDLEALVSSEIALLRQENSEQHAQNGARLDAIEQHLTTPGSTLRRVQ